MSAHARNVPLFPSFATALLLAVAVLAAVQAQGAQVVQPDSTITPASADPSAEFGTSMARLGDLLVVGAPWSNSAEGAIYVFEKGPGGWQQTARIQAPDRHTSQHFGWSLAAEGDLLAVGADWDDANGEQSGAVYLYERAGTGLTYQAKLQPSATGTYNYFGVYVGVHQSQVFASSWGNPSSYGAIHVFEDTGAGWGEVQTLTSPTGTEYYEGSIALHDGVLAIGAIYDGSFKPGAGSVYVYEKTGSTWGRVQKLNAPDGQNSDNFGEGLALSADAMLVGAPSHDSQGGSSGAVYAFAYDAATSSWQFQQKLLPADVDASDYFGSAIELEGDVAVVGAQGRNEGFQFQRVDGVWFDTERYLPPANGNQRIGNSVQMMDGTVLLGSIYAGTGGEVYEYAMAGPSEPATDPGEAPQDLTARPGPPLQAVTLTWSPPETVAVEPVDQYTVYRSTSATGPFSLLATVPATTTTYEDGGLTTGTTYHYHVTASNAVGESPPSLVAASAPVEVPEPPQALSAQRSGGDVVLDWLPPTSDGGRSIQHYTVYASTDGGATYTAVATVGASTTTRQSPACNPECYYEVTATNAVGESGRSNPTAALPKFTQFPPEAIRGTTPGAGGDLKQAFPCGDEGEESVNLVTGQFVGTTCLFSVGNHYDLGVTVELTHRSQSHSRGIVGWNWDLSIDRRIDLDDDGDALLNDGTGRIDRFVRTGPTTFDAPAGFYQVLHLEPDGSYRLDHPGGVFETFSPDGPRTAVGDAVGNRVRFSHDSDGRPMQVQDPAGRLLTFIYGGGKLVELRDWTDRVVQFSYLGDDLASIRMPGDGAPGPLHTFTYVDHNLRSAKDPEGNTYLLNTYDAATGRVKWQDHGDALRLFAYDTANAATTVTDGNGNRVQWLHGGLDNQIPLEKRTLASDDSFRTTTYQTNGHQELTRITRPGGGADVFTYDDQNPDPLAQGNLLESARVPSDGGAPVLTTFTYEPDYQKVRTRTGPLGNDPDHEPANGGTSTGRYTTTFWYGQDEHVQGDLNGDGEVGWAPSKVVRVDHPTTHADGAPDPVLSPASGYQARVETFVHNDHGQVTKHVDVDGAVTRYAYFGPDLGDPSQPEGYVQSITFQAAPEEPVGGFMAFSMTASASTTSTTSPAEYTYNVTYDAAGNVATVTDPAGRTTLREYDALGRPVRTVGPASLERLLTYDGNGNVVEQKTTNAVQAENGAYVPDAHPYVVDTYLYDALDRLIESRKDATVPGTAPPGTDETLFNQFAYDKNGNLVLHRRHAAVVGDDPNAVDTFVYDEEDRLVSSTQGGVNGAFAIQQGNADVDVTGVTDPSTLFLHSTAAQVPGTVDSTEAQAANEEAPFTTVVCVGSLKPHVPFSTCVDPLATDLPVDPDVPNPDWLDLERTIKMLEETGVDPGLAAGGGGGSGSGFAMDHQPPEDEVSSSTIVISGTGGGQNKVTWRAPTYGINLDGARMQLVFWARAPNGGDLPDDAWQARVYGGGQLIAASRGTPPAIEDEDGLRMYRLDLGTVTFSGSDLRLELELLPGSTPPPRFVLYDSVDTPARLEIGRAVTTTSAFDDDGHLVASVDGNGVPTFYAYDGLDRPTEVLRPDGTRDVTAYDPAGRVVAQQTFGALDGLGADASPGATVLLEDRRMSYDEAGRLFRQDVALFDPATGAPLPDAGITPGDGFATTFFEHDEAGRLVRQVDDDGAVRTRTYGGLGRVTVETDAAGNEMTYEYDDAGNLAARTAWELLDGGASTVPHTVLYQYDDLDRVVRTTDPVGQTQRFGYDARGNLAWETDARGPLIADPAGLFAGLINDHGNRIDHLYDAAGRPVSTDHSLTDTGEGGGSVVDHVVTTTAWDGEGRIIERTDDNGNPTTYAYDARGRLTQQTFADGTSKTFEYDGAGNLVRWTDAEGRVVSQTYDASNRLVERTIDAPGSSTVQTFEYDGMGRLTAATDNNDPATPDDDSLLAFAYDSASRPVAEQQDGLTVSRAFDGVGNLATLTYPGGRQVTRDHDALGRLTSLSDATGTLQSYAHDGTRLEARTLGNGIQTTLAYDDALRLTTLDHGATDGDVRFDYAYGRDNQRVAETHHHAPTWSQEAHYDSVGRLESTTRSNHAGLTLPASPLAADIATAAAWELDGANNWLSLQETRDGVPTQQTRTHGPTNELDAITGSETVAFTHDADGNRLADGEHAYTWDALGRLRTVSDATTGDPVASYTYDALNRRVSKTVAGETTRYVYDGSAVVEERDGDGDLLRQFVHGQRIDEVVVMDRDLDGDGSATGSGDERLHYLHDALGSVVALTDDTGRVVEGYLYDAYGRMSVVDPGPDGNVSWGDDDTVRSASAFDNPYGYTGQRYDAETGNLYYRARYYDPDAGRFLSRDPIGSWADGPNLGNAFAYVGGSPLSHRDPSGECRDWWALCTGTAVVGTTKGLWSAGTGIGEKALHCSDVGWGTCGDDFQRGVPLLIDRVGTGAQQELDCYSSGVGCENLCDGWDRAMLPWNSMGCHGAEVQQAYSDGTLCAGLDWYDRADCSMDVALGFTVPIGEAALMGYGAVVTTEAAFSKASQLGRPAGRFLSDDGAQVGPTGIGAGAGGKVYQAGGQTFYASKHAADQIVARKVTDDMLVRTLETKPFQYAHEGAIKTGYFDPTTNTFAGTVDGHITTVISGSRVRPYVERLGWQP